MLVGENNNRNLFSSTSLRGEATIDRSLLVGENNNRNLFSSTSLREEATIDDRC